MLDRLMVLLRRVRGGGVGALLARGAGAFLVIQITGILVTFGLHVVLARTMGVEEYGVWVYVFGWTTLLVLLCRVGFGTSGLRFVAAFVGTAQWGKLRGFLRLQNRVVLAASLAVSCASAALAWLLTPDPSMLHTFAIACLGLPLSAFAQVWSASIRALRYVVLSQVPGTLLQPALTALGVLALVALGIVPTAARAMAVLLAAAAVTAAVTAGVLRRVLPEPVAAAPVETRSLRWLRITLPMMAVNLLGMLSQRADVLVIGSVLGTAEAGLYAPARRMSLMIGFGLVAINSWAAPMIAELYARKEHEQLRRLTRRSAQIVFAFTAPTTLGVVVLGPWLLGIFGPEFQHAYPALVILAVGELGSALAGPVGFLMTMTGHQDDAAKILAVTAAANVALLFLLTPRFGIEGAAAATTLSTLAWNGSMVVAVWRRLGVRATIV